MQDDLEQLREENNRLKIIIKALADKVNLIENPDLSNVEKNIGVNSIDYSIDKNSIGVNSLIDTTIKKNMGVNSTDYSIDENSIGVNSLIKPIIEKNIGVNSSPNVIYEKKVGEKQLTWMLAVSGLRKEIRTSSISGIENSAKILVQLHEHQRNSYKELRKLTGLSEDGLTKRIMALKKRGLIVRTAFQQYTLTPKALKYWRKPYNNVAYNYTGVI